MTRVLSELLGAQEPAFQLSLQQLERSSGHPSHDIRMATHITQAVQEKLRELGLDMHDTTGPELYAVLGERLKADEERFARALLGSAENEGVAIEHVALQLEQAIVPKRCYAMKSTVAKKLLKQSTPKRTMKALGYRSADSMLKHETASALFAAAWLVESEQWTKKMVTAYGKLKSTDFESRDITIEHPTSKRWLALSEAVVAVRKHSVLSFKELGAVVLLPLPAAKPAMPTLTTAVLALNAVNDIRVSSTFLQLHQVRSNFGAMVKQVVTGEPMLSSELFDQPLSWSAVHRYYARLQSALRSEVFEPVIQGEDLAWHNIERVLTRIEPSLSFWQDTGHLGLLYQGKAVSFNVTDLVLSHCNRLPYHKRLSQYFEHSLTTELSLAYIDASRLEQAISSVLHNQPFNQLATEPVRVAA